MKVSILHPSRSRPELALNAGWHWLKNTSGEIEFEYIVSVDSSDPHLAKYLDYFPGALVSDNKNLVMAANVAAKKATGDILILISDDFQCFKNWDLAIVNALKEKSGVLKTFDGVQKWIVTLPIMTKDYYDAQGYFYHPSIHHMFSDTLMTHKADLEKKLVMRLDIVFRHNHYSLFKGQPKDGVNVKADSTWGQGEKVYLQQCRDWASQGRDIYNIQGHAHKGWLKQKLR